MRYKFASCLFLAFLTLSLFLNVSCKYAKEEHVYVEDLGKVWHLHNYFDDFYVDKDGLQISNNLSQPWADIVAGVSFTFRGRSYSFWTDSLSLEWTAFNGSSYAELNGTAQLIRGFVSLQFTLNYHLVWNSSYIQITPILIASSNYPDLKYQVENVILHYRMEDVSIDGNIADDFCAFLFNNETYEYFLPAYFEHSTVNITESLNHLFIYDNVTWKFVDYVWEWNYTLNQMQIPVNVTLIGDGANVQADFNYGNFPLQFIFRHSFWWHDPVETRYMRSDQHTINGLTAYKLDTTQTSSSTYQEITESGQYSCRWRAYVYVRHADGSENLVGYTAYIYRDTDGEGIQSVTLSVSLTSLSSTDAIRVRVRMLISSVDTYIDFITERLGASQLDEATWTFYLYTYRDVTGNPIIGYTTHARFYWGDSTHNSRIEGFSYTTAPVAYKLNLKIMDWDLADAIPNAYVYLKNDTSSYMKASDSNGWANWTGVSGTVYVNVSYFGFWVNGTFSISVSADTTLNVRCNLYDAYIKVLPNNQQGILYTANVTVFNGTCIQGNKIATSLTNKTGYVYLTNLPNNTLTFTVYAGSSYSTIIYNDSRTLTSDEQVLSSAVCNQNYGNVSIPWEIVMMPIAMVYFSKKAMASKNILKRNKN